MLSRKSWIPGRKPNPEGRWWKHLSLTSWSSDIQGKDYLSLNTQQMSWFPKFKNLRRALLGNKFFFWFRNSELWWYWKMYSDPGDLVTSGATRKPVADSGQNRFFFSARLFSQCWCEIRNHSWYISCSPRALLSLIYKLSRAISTLGRRLRALNSTREAQNKREPAALSIATDQNSIP